METGSARGPAPGAGLPGPDQPGNVEPGVPELDAEPAVAEPSPEPSPEPAVARQRWRLVLARRREAPGRSGRDLTETWEAAFESSGLPSFRPAGRARPRVAFAAPLPAGIAAEHELADIVLTAFEPAWRVRAAMADRLPEGWRLIDLYDVWLGAPALAGQVVAADYRIDLGGADPRAIGAAAAALLAAERLPRSRLKGGSTVMYDLRPLLADVRVADAGPPLLVRARARFDPELGTGRPAEIVAALGDMAGTELVVGSVVREHLILADDLERGGDRGW